MKPLTLAKRILDEIRYAHQRLTRGWDDRSVWALDHHLTTSLGAQLVHLADTTHGHPADPNWTPDTWTTELRRHGHALLAYSRDDGTDQTTVDQGAREALEFVASHLGALWD